jgi:mRNA-degrading endonuclease RelE of RelBE toxin-antitoxin system
MRGYVVTWSEEAKEELRRLRSFLRPTVERAVGLLAFEAEIEMRHRKRLRPDKGLPPEYPDPLWELRIGEGRVLYTVEGRTVVILRVILKGRGTTGESL